jgi:hypothetical protein
MTFGFELSIAMALTEREGNPVFTYVQGDSPIPPVVDFHRPPLADPTQTLSGSLGCRAMARTLPPTFVGPSETHCGETASRAAAFRPFLIAVFT